MSRAISIAAWAPRARRWVPTLLVLVLAAGWASREVAFARQKADMIRSATITLDQVEMKEYDDINAGPGVGKVGVYTAGESPGSSKFITGRFVLQPGKSPHPPHTHVEEEVMIVESGTGDIFCDGKTTKVGPGSVMFTTPNAPHGILNTGSTPLVFYFIKWADKHADAVQ